MTDPNPVTVYADQSRITLHLTALTTVQLRAAIVAHRHAAESTGPSIPKTDGDRRPFVGVLPGDKFSMVTLPLTRSGAIDVLIAIENARRLAIPVTLTATEALEQIYDDRNAMAIRPSTSVDEALAQIVPPLVHRKENLASVMTPPSNRFPRRVDFWWSPKDGAWVDAWNGTYQTEEEAEEAAEAVDPGPRVLEHGEAIISEDEAEKRRSPFPDFSMFEDRAVTMADAENTDTNPHPSSPIEPLCCSFHFPTKPDSPKTP